jgi:hypothetical protein
MPLPNFEEKKFQSCKLMDDKEEEEEDPVSFPPPSFKTDETTHSIPNQTNRYQVTVLQHQVKILLLMMDQNKIRDLAPFV